MIKASDWWAGLIGYNTALYPLQLVIMAIAAVLTIILIFKPGKIASTAMKLFLSFSMFLNGILFFIVLGTKLVAPLKYVQGGLFIIIGILLAIDIFNSQSELRFPTKGVSRNIAYALLIIVALYPVIGLLRGHSPMQLIYPGTLPCGSTAFALVILSASLPKVSKLPYILLLVWAIPFAPLIQIPQFKVYEDIIMFAIGVYALVQLVRVRFFRKNKEALS